jgi:hypothetical protein
MKLTFIVLLAAFLFVGCAGTIDVVLKPNTNFNRSSSITVESELYDSEGLQPRIESALLKLGFNVASPSAAQRKTEYNSNSANKLSSPSSQRIPESGSFQSSMQSTTQFRSVYLLKYNYHSDYGYTSWTDTGDKLVITQFSASIFDLRTGEVVGTITEDGQLTPDDLARRISEKLSQQLTQ